MKLFTRISRWGAGLFSGKDQSMAGADRKLERAAQGLLYPSETDAPVRAFAWRDASPFSAEALAAKLGYDTSTPIQTTDLDTFFEPVTKPQAWYGDEEQERMRRFIALRDLLKADLRDLKVYRIGSTSIDVYVVGRDARGRYYGVYTKVVET